MLDKEIKQIKQLKTVGYLDTKGQHKIKKIIRFYLKKMRKKKQYSCRCWAFFKNRN